MASNELICKAIDLIEEELTEERTDTAIEFLLSKVPQPAVAKMIENRVLDQLLPEHLISALRTAFKCEGAIIGNANVSPTVNQ